MSAKPRLKKESSTIEREKRERSRKKASRACKKINENEKTTLKEPYCLVNRRNRTTAPPSPPTLAPLHLRVKNKKNKRNAKPSQGTLL